MTRFEMAAKAKVLGVPSLLDRVQALQDEISDLIDSRVHDLAKETYGVPKPVLRAMLMAKGNGACARTYQAMKEEN
jgi:hypothetical protein